MIKIGSQFTGVGAFEMALKRLNIPFDNIYAAEWDKYARQTYLANFKEPLFYIKDVNDTPINDIPQLDLVMFSPPCQSFSLAGKRGGESDQRGILFYNSHEFIKVNKPKYFIFENVKGLLSDDKKNPKDEIGRTFRRWLDYLGGKSVNGNPVIFPHEESVPYHIYHKVLNAKHYGVPQNRERVFIIGIRDDNNNKFTWPKPFHLTKKLKDVLESYVDKKYYLSDKMIHTLFETSSGKNNQFLPAIARNENDTASSITARYFKMGRQDNYLKIKSATKKGYETAKEGDSINFSVPNSETRRGRVGKEVAQTLDTACNQGILVSKEVRTQESKNIRKETGTNEFRGKEIEFRESNVINCITSGLTKDHFLKENYRIRRLTPTECFRLMDFNENFKWNVSDTQAYKQAGNSIVVAVLYHILNKLIF